MMLKSILALSLIALSLPAFAGDPKAGGQVFKKCLACGKKFLDGPREPFRTCFSCRRPLPLSQRADGCHFWQGLRSADSQIVDVRTKAK